MTVQNDERAQRLEQAIRLKKAAARSRERELSPRPADERARLGEMQHSLWLAHQIEPRSPAYNLASAFRVHGPLDVSRLERALDDVVSRHRLLRSTFHADGDAVLQKVHPPTPLSLEVREVADSEVLAAAVDEARAPFVLDTGPLVRMRLIEDTSKRERLLVLVLHHILADERSLGLLWNELAAAYRNESAGEPRIQYDDFVHWLRHQGGDARRHEIDYWRRRLDPLPDDLNLPFENKTPSKEASAPGRLLDRRVSASVHQGIRRLAAATGATPFVVSAFAFQLLLQRYTDKERIAFATPVSTRSHSATANMIGYFTNPVVVSTLVDERKGVKRALREFGRELREFLTHASIPFQTVAEALSPPRRRDRHPIFQVMFVYQEATTPPQLGDARLEPITLDLGASKFDLTLFVNENERALELAVEYRTDRFDELWMEKLLDHYETLLENLPTDLERSTAKVAMLSAHERRELRAAAQGVALDTTGIDLLPQQILDEARRSPGSPALICGGERQSYGELLGSIRSIARELSSHGVGPGDRVGVFVDRSLGMIAGLLAVQWVSAAYVPLDPAYPRARNLDILEDAEVAAVLTTTDLRSGLPAGAWASIDVDALEANDDAAEIPVDVAPDDAAYLLYTSGSTGRPKGVVVTHDNLRASTAARTHYYDVSPKRFLLVPSVAFDSSVAGLFWTLADGGTLVIPTDGEARDPRRLAELIAEHRVTGLLCVPSLYAQMLAVGGESMKALDIAIVAGESCTSALAREHAQTLPQVRLFNEYGPTEATVWATVHEVSEEDASRPVAIGRPIPGVSVDVVDSLGRAVPAGIPGHAWIEGATVAAGYWRRPELTAERFVADERETAKRRYRTGDVMAWTPDGRLLFLGRDDDQIKLRGFRIEPGEIEAALVERPAIEQAAVVDRPLGATAAGSKTLQLVAFVQTTPGATIEGWREALAKRLPSHMIPSRLVRLPELPRLPNGKIDRQRLREMTLEAEAAVAEHFRVPSTREQALLSLWEGLLGRSGIGVSDNFFELGGHSLLVVEMTQAIERDFEVSLSAADVFDNPTVHQLAGRLEQRGETAAPYQHLFPIQPTGRGMPFIVAVPHFFSPMFAARFRGERPVYGLRGVSLRADGNRGRWRTMTDLGEELVDEIRRRFPDTTSIVAGYSFGASMAIEAVRLLEARGIPVHRLILIAPMPVDFYRWGPFRLQLDGLRQPVDELSAAEALLRYARSNNPLTLRPYRRVWRWLAIEPWRRLLCLVGKLRLALGLPLTPRILHADVRVERFRLHAQWQPGIVQTPTVIFNAREAETDAAATWRPYFRGPFTVHETPDPHFGDASAEAARQVILRHLSDLDDA